MKTTFVLFALIVAAGLARADCVQDAALRYKVNADLLWAIGDVESHHDADAVGVPLADGNVALGSFQINTIHLSELARYGVVKADLFDRCKSAFFGGWVLARCIKVKGNTRDAVGCYNTGPASTNVEAQERYIAKVEASYYRRISGVSPNLSTSKSVQHVKLTAPAVPSRMMIVWGSDE
jgi:hypothetical protein